jgi:hypothetical protein
MDSHLLQHFISPWEEHSEKFIGYRTVLFIHDWGLCFYTIWPMYSTIRIRCINSHVWWQCSCAGSRTMSDDNYNVSWSLTGSRELMKDTLRNAPCLLNHDYFNNQNVLNNSHKYLFHWNSLRKKCHAHILWSNTYGVNYHILRNFQS